jgi:hypothetical protein
LCGITQALLAHQDDSARFGSLGLAWATYYTSGLKDDLVGYWHRRCSTRMYIYILYKHTIEDDWRRMGGMAGKVSACRFWRTDVRVGAFVHDGITHALARQDDSAWLASLGLRLLMQVAWRTIGRFQ